MWGTLSANLKIFGRMFLGVLAFCLLFLFSSLVNNTYRPELIKSDLFAMMGIPKISLQPPCSRPSLQISE